MEIEVAKLVVMGAGFVGTNLAVVFAAWLNVNVRLKALEVDHENHKQWSEGFERRTNDRFEKYAAKTEKLVTEIHELVVQLARQESRHDREREA